MALDVFKELDVFLSKRFQIGHPYILQ